MSKGSIIKSIQEFSIVIAALSTSNTATISAVTTSKSVVIFNGQNTNNTTALSQNNAFGYLALTNSTTVTATRDSGLTNNLTVYGMVIEFASDAVVSMQTGTIVLGSGVTSNTATISSVSTSNAFVVYGGLLSTTSGSVTMRTALTAIDLTDATTVTAIRSLGTDSATVAYTVVELRPSIIKSVQKVSVTSTAGTTTDDATISAVVLANTVTFGNGMITGVVAQRDSNMYRSYLTSTTNYRFERYGTSTTSRTMKATVIEFEPQYIAARNSYQVSVTTADTQVDTAVTMTNRGKVLVNFMGSMYNNATSTLSSAQVGALSTSTTNVRTIRDSTNSIAADSAFSLIQFV